MLELIFYGLIAAKFANKALKKAKKINQGSRIPGWKKVSLV
jgi:hypothetical protein